MKIVLFSLILLVLGCDTPDNSIINDVKRDTVQKSNGNVIYFNTIGSNKFSEFICLNKNGDTLEKGIQKKMR